MFLPSEFAAPQAPAGWGFVPGTPLVLSPEDLPDIPGLDRMPQKCRFHAVRAVLQERPTLIPNLTPPILNERYPALTRQQCTDLVSPTSKTWRR